MKILNITEQHNANFCGGMTSKIKSEIASTDCKRIEAALFREQGINTDFAGNKVIAWCVKKVTDIFTELNNKYKLNLFFPQNVMTEDLRKFKGMPENMIYGFTNFLPCRLYKNEDTILPPMSIVFNRDFAWERLDIISDYDYSNNHTATDNFLESFFHEFCHILHEGNLITKFGPAKFSDKISEMTNKKESLIFNKKYSRLICRQLCNYAAENPTDLIACDMSKRFIKNIDSNTFETTSNPYKDSPYNSFYKYLQLFDKQFNLDKLIYKIYNGQSIK